MIKITFKEEMIDSAWEEMYTENNAWVGS